MDNRWWSFRDLESYTGYRYKWLTRNILFRPCYRKVLDVKNGGPAFYPEKPGDRWRFVRTGMIDFLDKHFSDILRGDEAV